MSDWILDRRLWAGVAIAAGLCAVVSAQAGDSEAQGARLAPGSYRVAQLFGESDEEKAARLQREQSQDASIRYLRQRLSDLESSQRQLTGKIEQLDHRIDGLIERVKRMQKDFDYRLCTLSAQQLGASGNGESGLPCAGQGMPGPANATPTPSPDEEPDAAKAPTHLAPPPRILGTLPAKPGRSDAQQANAAPESAGGHGSKFAAAMHLLTKAQYDEARSAFRSFANNYPQDARAPEALYWVGDIAYVRRDYTGAAHAFAEEIKKYPSSSRGPLSMLKLGKSLIAMGQKQEGCSALDALPTKYPDAPKTVTDGAAKAQKNSGCD